MWRVDDPYTLIQRVVRKYSQGKIGAARHQEGVRRSLHLHWGQRISADADLWLVGVRDGQAVHQGARRVLAHDEFRRLMC